MTNSNEKLNTLREEVSGKTNVLWKVINKHLTPEVQQFIIQFIEDKLSESEAKHHEEIPEYNFAQLRLLVHALEMLDTSEYDLGNVETHRYLIERFRKQLKKYDE